MTVTAEVIAIASPSCAKCRASLRACSLGCDSLPTPVVVRIDGQDDVWTWLANDPQVSVCIRALATPDARIVIGSDELDALYPAWLIAGLDHDTDTEDVTHEQEG